MADNSSQLLYAKLVKAISDSAQAQARKELTSRPRPQNQVIFIRYHQTAQELVIGGKPADMSYAIVKTMVDVTPPTTP